MTAQRELVATGGADRPRSCGALFSRSNLDGEAIQAARSLLGAVLVRDDGGVRRSARIVEVEAYGGADDAASHARFGSSGRSGPMFGRAGCAYVYLVYGMHHCLNVTTGPDGTAGAVLIRAVRPLEGVEALRAARIAAARGSNARRIASLPADLLCSGPALVTAAFGVDRGLNQVDLLDRDGSIRIEVAARDAEAGAPELGTIDEVVEASPRVGIAYASEPWRSIAWRLRLRPSPGAPRPRTLAGRC